MTISEQLYRELLATHDWYYAFSDDHSVYRRGKGVDDKILGLAKQIDPDYKIFNEYAPDDCKITKR